jgi:hypothetical protein
MRAAEFFAAWGSTPGPMLAAGLQSMKKTIPGLIADKDAQKKYLRELDKSIYDLDKAARLEKAGEFDEATKIKEGQAKTVQGIVTSLTNIYEADERNKATRAAAGSKGEDADIKRVNLAETRIQNALKNNVEYQQLLANAKSGGEASADQLARIAQIESAYRQHYYQQFNLPTGAEVKIPESQAALKTKREGLEKTIEQNTPMFGFTDTEAKKRKREEAQRELAAMGGSSDNKDRKPLSSFDK